MNRTPGSETLEENPVHSDDIRTVTRAITAQLAVIGDELAKVSDQLEFIAKKI